MSDLQTATTPESVRPYLESYGRMQAIRMFEEEMHRLFLRGEVHGTTHLAAGQEASASASARRSSPTTTSPAPTAATATRWPRAPTAHGMVAEMLGRATGIYGGRSGSMNVIDRAHGLVGCYGIVGGSIAAATGAGLAARKRRAASPSRSSATARPTRRTSSSA